MSRDATLARVSITCAELGDDELRTLAYLAERLLLGQKQYGRVSIADDPRDWKRERTAEIADLLVYSAFEALKNGLAQ